MDKSKRRYRAWKQTKATLHTLLRSKRKFALPEHMLQGMYGKFLMTFKHNQIMAVALMVAEEQVLAVYGIDILPIFQGELYGRQRRMGMKFIAEAVLLKEVKHLGYSWIICHLLMLFA
jgi:hypothetical protein